MGGTFTDIVLMDEATGALTIAKVPSVPADPAAGLVDAIRRALAKAGAAPDAVTLLIHGTTIVTNAVLEGKLPRTALVTTEGFRDVLEIGRHLRPDMYDLFQDKPAPIVPRDLRLGVRERTAADGTILIPLDEAAAGAVAERLRTAGVEAVAICFLHAYTNPTNEHAMRAVLAARLPEVCLSASSDVCREIREYERASTVALNAATVPLMARYLEVIQARVTAVIPKAQILLMQSSGGSITVGAAKQTPVHLITSGPAAGVLAAQFIGQATDREDVLGFDMGGTSTDISLVHRGAPRMTTEGGIGGHPVKLPMLEVNTIGAGGGSIAWLDAGGGLRVGPQSAGADPGPAAYRRGGDRPTVTDANLVLGRLAPDKFLGGDMRLDVEAARRAISDRIAAPLGMETLRAAAGIIRIANANMERALRVSSAERGYDPRLFTLVAFGGAGPMHGAAVARAVGFNAVLVPEAPGVFSALGLLVADIRHDFVQSHLVSAAQASPGALEREYAALEARAAEALREDGVPAEQCALLRTADVRYVGQAYEVNVPVRAGRVDASGIAATVHRFHEEHHRLFAHSDPADPVEFVNLRVAALGRVAAPRLRRRRAEGPATAAAGRRPVYFDGAGDFVDCAIYDRTALPAGARLAGPAIVEQMDCTTVIHPHQSAEVDAFGNLVIAVGSRAHGG